MRIGIDAKWYFTGPVSTRVMLRNLLPPLFNAHQDQEWFVFLDKKDKDKTFPFKQVNIHCIYVAVPTNLVANLLILPRYARRLRLDTVVFQTYAGSGKGFRSIAFVHDILFKRFPQYFTWKEKLYFVPLPFFTRRADRVVATTDFVKNELMTYRFVRSSDQVDIVPLGISADFKPLGQQQQLVDISTRYHLPANFILFVGRLNARKNIGSLIKALALLDDQSISLVIAGKEDWKAAGINDLIKNPEIRNRIRITGPVSDEDISIFFALARVFCFPSFAEGFGLPPLEAMASGVPVVVSDTTSLPEVCGTAAVYADPHHPASIAKGINELLRDQAFYQNMKAKGLQRAEGFTWGNSARLLMESIFKSVKPDLHEYRLPHLR
jgi:glycosyltransferase involved in cell wall biosynthesis